MSDPIDQLTTLFEQAGKAHHEAFAAVDGADPEWPTWYADYLLDKLSPLLKKTFTRNELANVLTQLSKDHAANAPNEPWPRHYANYFIEQYS